jgi:hypothetical protein
MSILNLVDWAAVRRHYDERIKVHSLLRELHKEGSTLKFTNLALGISDPTGNYSAVEHGLGPKILGTNINAEKQVFNLADKFLTLNSARIVPEMVKAANLKYLQIGVGSEVSCMINPKVCWVANTRTIWAHLVIKHADNVGKANDELRLYREADVTSKMAYENWSAIHAELDVALTRNCRDGRNPRYEGRGFPRRCYLSLGRRNSVASL